MVSIKWPKTKARAGRRADRDSEVMQRVPAFDNSTTEEWETLLQYRPDISFKVAKAVQDGISETSLKDTILAIPVGERNGASFNSAIDEVMQNKRAPGRPFAREELRTATGR